MDADGEALHLSWRAERRPRNRDDMPEEPRERKASDKEADDERR